MELRRYSLILRRWRWLIFLLTILSTAATFVLNSLSTPVYQASTTILINQAPSTSATQDYNSVLAGQSLTQTYKELLTKRPVLTKVIADLGLNMATEQLENKIKVDNVHNTLLLILSVEDKNPQLAATIANALAKDAIIQNQDLLASRYMATRQSLETELSKIQSDIARSQTALDALKIPSSPEQQVEQTKLQTELTQYRTSYASLLKSYEDLRLAEALNTSNLKVVEEAQPPVKPVRPNVPLSTLLGGLVGLLLATGIAFLIEYLDDSVKTTEQIEQLANTAVLGVISRMKGKDLPSRQIDFRHSTSPTAEAIRVLCANIEFCRVDNPIRTLLVTSSNAREGKSTIIVNLAIAFAQLGKRVILVDTDLRRPSLHNYFLQANVRGVTTALLEQGGDVSDYLLSSPLDNLKFLASGPLPPNPAELLGSNRMRELLNELKTRADIVLFDSSPLLPVIDATLLARLCDATLIVVSSGNTKADNLKKAYNQLQHSGARVLGTVLNRASSGKNSYYNYYPKDFSKEEEKKKLFFFLKHKQSLTSVELSETRITNPSFAADSGGEFSSSHKIDRPDTQAIDRAFRLPMIVPGKLTVIEGQAAGQIFQIQSEIVRVGRSLHLNSSPEVTCSTNLTNTCNSTVVTSQVGAGLFLINDEKISRQHVEITCRVDGYYLRDLESTNGTWLNGKKLGKEPELLEDGAEIKLGYRTTIVYHQTI